VPEALRGFDIFEWYRLDAAGLSKYEMGEESKDEYGK
jgi:hypothetical protein